MKPRTASSYQPTRLPDAAHADLEQTEDLLFLLDRRDMDDELIELRVKQACQRQPLMDRLLAPIVGLLHNGRNVTSKLRAHLLRRNPHVRKYRRLA